MAAIIFDFDGTIADSFDYVAGFLADEAGIGHLSDTRKQELNGLSMPAMARHLGYSWWRMPGLLFKGRRRMSKVIKRLKPFNGMTEVIEKLHAEGHELFIVSTNSVRNVRAFLHHHGLHTYFLEIYGGVGLFSKASALRKLLRGQNLNSKNAIYIGDELRDVQAAQSLGLRVIAVGWGFARNSDLQTLRPTALVQTPADLLDVLEKA
jgi:phosphoglycolate phosphatase